MSMPALLDATAAHIRAECGYDSKMCDVQPDGRPEPASGQVFVAVHDGEWTHGPVEEALDEYFGVRVTVSLRIAYVPQDRQGQESVRKARTGIYARAEAIRAAVHMSYGLMDAANAIIGAAANGFVEPLRFVSSSGVRLESSSWWDAHEDDEPGDRSAGLVLELAFGRARRVQRFDGPMS